MKKKHLKRIKIAYITVLILLGVIIGLYWQGTRYNVLDLSKEFDVLTEKIFQESGISSSDTITKSVKKNKSGGYSWLEFYREIRLPAAIDEKIFLTRIETLALKKKLSVKKSKLKNNTFSVEVSRGNKIFYKLVALMPVSKLKVQQRHKKRIAIVVDDLGYSKKTLLEYFKLNVPITFAILPQERYSREIARELNKRNMPYILHLPLEPAGYPDINPGDNALLLEMSERTITGKFLSNIDSVPGISGVSNHMGSAFSADSDKMSILLKLIKERKMFYFDSYTNSKSKAKLISDSIGLPCRENNIFFDLKDEHKYMINQFEKALKMAERNGECIGIGHIQRKHFLPVLREIVPKFKEKGVEFVYLTDLMNANN